MDNEDKPEFEVLFLDDGETFSGVFGTVLILTQEGYDYLHNNSGVNIEDIPKEYIKKEYNIADLLTFWDQHNQ